MQCKTLLFSFAILLVTTLMVVLPETPLEAAGKAGEIKFSTQAGLYYRLRVDLEPNLQGSPAKFELTLFERTKVSKDGSVEVFRKKGRIITTSGKMKGTKTLKLKKGTKYKLYYEGYNFLFNVQVLSNKQGGKYNPIVVAKKSGRT